MIVRIVDDRRVGADQHQVIGCRWAGDFGEVVVAQRELGCQVEIAGNVGLSVLHPVDGRSGLSIAPTCIRFIPLSNSDGPRNVGNCSPASIDIEAPARNIDPSAIVYENRTTANPNVTLHRRVVTPRRQGPAVPYDHSRPKRSSIS